MATVKIWRCFYNRNRRAKQFQATKKQLRIKELRIRLTQKEHQRILALARILAKSPAVYVREVALGLPLKSTSTLENRERWMLLGRMGSDLYQLKQVIFQSKSVPHEVMEKLDEALYSIKDLREKLP